MIGHMASKEVEHSVSTMLFDDPQSYNEFLKSRKQTDFSSRALGFLNQDGSIDVAVDKFYYLRGGILEEQLEAIAVHERIELTSEKSVGHQLATIGEYQFIFDHYGKDGLQKYHSNLCNLLGGRNDIRNLALKTVLKIT